MSNTEKLREKFSTFVNQLSPDQVREQLILSYLQMERCQQVLQGEDVEPVVMMELFYRCKKVSEELSYLNGVISEKTT